MLATLAHIDFAMGDSFKGIRRVCGTALSDAYVQALVGRPMHSRKCPNPTCRYVHRFVPPSTLRTMLLSMTKTDERDTRILETT